LLVDRFREAVDDPDVERPEPIAIGTMPDNVVQGK
jgi:hypothetical protein